MLTAKPVYSKCSDSTSKPKEIKFTAQITCVFLSIIDWLIYRSIFTDTTENSFQAFGRGKHAKILVMSQSVSPHQLQRVIKHLEDAACIRNGPPTSASHSSHSQIWKHCCTLRTSLLSQFKEKTHNQNTRAVNPWKALWSHSLTCLINMEIMKTFWLVKLAVSLMHSLAPACTDCWLGTLKGPLLTFLNRPMLISLSFPRSRTKSCLLKCLLNS